MCSRRIRISGKKLVSAVRFLSLVLFCLGIFTTHGRGADFRTIKVKKGDSLSYLSFKVYKKYDDTIAAWIKKYNPGIKNINSIRVGQKIRFPKLSLLRDGPPKTQTDKKKPATAAQHVEKTLPKAAKPVNRLQPKDAYLTFLRGTAKLRRRQAQKWRSIRVNTKLRQGDRVRIGKKSKAEIITFDSDIIRLSQNSELTINYLQNNPVKKIKKKGLFLKIGRMWNKAKSLLHSKSEYTVKTPNAISGIKGTSYNIDVSDEETTRIKTYSGSVKVWRFPPQASNEEGWKIAKPVPIQGPKPVTMEAWVEIILKLNEELTITRQGTTKRAFDPKYDEAHDDWIKWNKMRDKEFDSSNTWD
ncbi:MAG: FecR domain-containing protein [Desulfobacterales bacterium]